ncbi:DUF1735 domain-containing protein [Pedobacter frigoris]|uniref:DUF1735 domain-containing protein n=2 Tax=Pedobacter frigoris TaxID=2571272 RepID=A0A4U1CQS4_9SPHI|nr:DUF1735 domain-containing protein [Pedobacter frigoris]
MRIMKKIFIQLQLVFIGLTAILISSCKRESLDNVLSKETYPGVTVAMTTKTEIGTGSSFTLNGLELKVPVTINFSSETTRAFTIQLQSKTDTIAQLITAGQLPVGTVPLAEGVFTLPPVVNVPIGVKSFTFEVAVSRSFLEIQYGKKIALVVKIENPSKGNSIETGKNAAILVMNTNQLIDEASVHTIYFGTGNMIFNVPSANNFSKGSEDITISVPIQLQGEPGAEFTVDAVTSPDSVTKYINNGTLPNSVLYPASNFSVINSKVRFEPNSSKATLTITTKILKLITIINKMPTIAFALKSPSKFQVAPKLHTVYLVIDQGAFRSYYDAPFLIKGAINAVSDPIYAAYYDFGGEGVAYHDDNGKSGDGNWRIPDMVDVSGDYNPRTAIGWTAANEWVTYTVYVEESGTYQMDMYFGASNSNGRYSVFMDNVDINGGIKTSQNTGAHNNQKSHLSTVTLTKGRHVFKVFFNGGDPDYRGTIFTRKS